MNPITLFRRKLHNLVSDKKFSEILTGSAWALGARVLAAGLGLISSIIIARFYGAEVMGIVAVINSFLLLATIFTVLGDWHLHFAAHPGAPGQVFANIGLQGLSQEPVHKTSKSGRRRLRSGTSYLTSPMNFS